MARAVIKTFLSDGQIKDSYEKTLVPIWYLKAQNLLKASKLLEEHDQLFDQIKTQKGFSDSKSNLMSVILMLRGMGLECLLKGLLTKQGKITPSNGKLDLPEKYRIHNLRKMAEDVNGLSLEEDEYTTLSTLSQQITLARLPLKKAPTKSEMEQGAWTFPHDEVVYEKVLEKILAIG